MEKYIEIFKNLGTGKKGALIGAAAFVIAALLVLVLWNSGPEYQVLYSNLSAEDSGAVIEKLKEKRIQYKVAGTTIKIPSDKVHETRMELAGEGLPQGGGIGFEILDKGSGFGVTEFVQKVNYRRALQGELARTISQIKEVESARVHLALPEKGVFLDEQKSAKASIVIKLKSGKNLSQGQVSSIVHLVSNSFEDLKPEDVTVVDTSGRMWTKETGDNLMHLTSTQLDYKRTLERDLENRVQSMLEKAVGMNKAVARVSVDLDTKHIERTEEKFDPDGQVIRSEQRNKENTIGSSMIAGVPGVLSNLPDTGQQAQVQQGPPPQSQKQNDIVNYEISKVTSRIVEPVGNIERMTVAVLVDGNYKAAKAEDGSETRAYVARTDEEIAKFTEMVKGAVGFTEGRGDTISVISTPFDSEFADLNEKEPIIPQYLLPTLIRYASLLVIALVAIFFLLRPILKRLLAERQAEMPIDQVSISTAEQPSAAAALASPSGEDPMEDLKIMVRRNPQQAAMVLRGWVKEK